MARRCVRPIRRSSDEPGVPRRPARKRRINPLTHDQPPDGGRSASTMYVHHAPRIARSVLAGVMPLTPTKTPHGHRPPRRWWIVVIRAWARHGWAGPGQEGGLAIAGCSFAGFLYGLASSACGPSGFTPCPRPCARVGIGSVARCRLAAGAGPTHGSVGPEKPFELLAIGWLADCQVVGGFKGGAAALGGGDQVVAAGAQVAIQEIASPVATSVEVPVTAGSSCWMRFPGWSFIRCT